MKSRTVLLLAVALGCGVAAAVVVKKFSDGISEPSTEQALVAVADFKSGDRIVNVDKQLEPRKFLKGTIPPGAITPEDVQAKPGDVLNKIVMKPLARGEALTVKHLTDDSIALGLPPGYRAISVPVRVENTVTGFAWPGTRVDLLTTFNQDNRLVAKLFMQNVKVLAIGTETQRAPEQPAMPNATVATLAVTPREAEKIVWALRQGGNISMALRKPGDDEVVRKTGVHGLDPNEKDTVSDDPTEDILVARLDLDKEVDLKDVGTLFEVKRVPAGTFMEDSIVRSLSDPALRSPKLREALKRGSPLLRTFLDKPAVAVAAPPVHVMTIYEGLKMTRTTFAQRDGNASTNESREVVPTP